MAAAARRKTVLVLGAGASLTYGYPTGRQLTDKIRALDEHSIMEALPSGAFMRVSTFKDLFIRSRMPSIDRFVAMHPECENVAKTAIALVLLEAERDEALYPNAGADDWYGYLVDKLLPDKFEEFDPSWLTVVTFNYDRSLDWVLRRATGAAYGDEASAPTAPRVKILHVYGGLDRLALDYGGYHELPSDHQSYLAREAADRLHLISTAREDRKHIDEIQRALREAERVCFLGFSFDRLNIARLGAPGVFVRGDGLVPVAATTYGMKNSEVVQARGRLFEGASSAGGLAVHVGADSLRHENTTCQDMLRELLWLDD